MTPELRAQRLEEIARLEAKLASVQDADIREAVQAKVAGLKASMPPETEVVAEVVEEVVPEATPEELAKAENFVRLARVEKMRGNAAKSTDLLREAAAVAPNSPALHEALGDDLMARRQVKAAREAYAKAVKLDPKNVGLETKYAECVLGMASLGSLEDQMRMNLSDSPFLSPGESLATARSATFISFFVPGGGQLVLGMTVAGLVILVTWLAMVFWIFLQKDQLQGLLGMVGIRPVTGSAKSGGSVVLFPIVIAAALHIGALLQCASLAKSGGRRPSNRPEPPVNLKF